ncbi:uncharacterized protein RHOBADRAFT_52303 [Rhodotorula graminis WP1]|uniref:Small ribosomal subunit protein mS38 n=1 Tax=Rhodotorula graminis (strain WP1) TaxID=578459 RepID=A0A194S6B0_RHOGW|nr:uncharacterized protein RHOBADRAFT_52303 [Rhodotorula graminis WP1]KPV76268.1 hypothetical protein RHOBADRAFT_52303 [Rhodotorula graminis WP1]
MPLRLPRPSGSLALAHWSRALVHPHFAPAPVGDALRPSGRCGYSSSSSAGRSSSRDGSPRVNKPTTTTTSASPSPRSSSPAPKPSHAAKPNTLAALKSPQPELKRAFELPHVRQGLVGLDAFFAGPRPLLELPLPLGTRRSTSAATTDSAHVPGERLDLLATRAEADEDVLVVDQADDGSPVGEPYLARLKPMQSLKTVDEELAAEAAEEADLMQRPDEASGVADRFLSHANFLWRWHARNDFIDAAGEPLRQAGAYYAGTPALAPSPSLEAGADAQGSIRMWREHDGWVDVAVGLGRGDSVFLPADMVDLDAGDVEIRLDSTKRKRRTKMKKHKFKKRRKAQRALRQRLGK